LPANVGEFVPLLGAWPQDPFNGKSMIYLPKKAIVYCVGPDLTDDGGAIATIPSKGKDFGISLELDAPEPAPKADPPRSLFGD
jgi:hypothetical protein